MIECINKDRFQFINFFNELGKISKYNQVNSIEMNRIKRIVNCFTALYDKTNDIIIDPEKFNARKDTIVGTLNAPYDLEIIFVSGVTLKDANVYDNKGYIHKYFGSYDSLHTSRGTIIIFEDMFIRWIVDVHTSYNNNMIPLDIISDEEGYLLISQKHFYDDILSNLFNMIYYSSKYNINNNFNLFKNNSFYTKRFDTSYGSTFLGQRINVDRLIMLTSIKRALKKANPFEDQSTIDMYMKHIIYNSLGTISFVNDCILDTINIIDSDDFQKLSYIDKHLEVAERIVKIREDIKEYDHTTREEKSN